MAKPRILGGSAKGRSLDTPKEGTRPAPAKVREAVFNSLQFRTGSFLDLFSGSGAMALEAASRGWEVTAVELARRAAQTIDRNARELQLEINLVRGDALEYARSHGDFDVVFASPPYTDENLLEIYSALLAAGPAARDGVYLLQHPSRIELDLPARADFRKRVYGNNTVTELSAASLAP